MNLQKRITLVTVSLLIIILLPTIIIFTWIAQTSLLKRAEQEGVQFAQLLTQVAQSYQTIPTDVEKVIGEQMVVATTIMAHLAAIAEQAGLSHAQVSQHLRDIATSSHIDEFWISDEQGHVVSTNTKHTFSFDPDPQKQPQAHEFWKLLTGEARTVIQAAMRREVDDQHFKYVGVAGIDKPRIVQAGYNVRLLTQLHEQVGLSQLIKQLLAVSQVQGIWMFDTQFNLLASGIRDNVTLSKHVVLDSDSQQSNNLRVAMTERKTISCIYQHRLKIMTPLIDVTGKVVGVTLIYLSTDTVRAVLRQQIYLAILILSVALIFGILAAIRLARWLSLPLQQLGVTAGALANGEWQQAVPTDRPDEIGQLARAFHTMSKRLQESFDTLEQRVHLRTSELSRANAEIECLLRKLEKDNLRMAAELNITRQLQQMILPRAAELLQFSKLDIAGFMEPASEVGGDYYDVLDCHGHTVIGIGDVTGHGLASGVLMLMVQTAVRALTLNHNCRLEECLGTLNRTIYQNVQRMDTDKNLTLTLLDYNEGKLVVSGQHEEVLVMRQQGEIERIDTLDLGFMIGIEPDISQFIARHEITLQPGDGIVLYTDGITEAKNAQDEMYGVARLCQVLQQHRHLTAKELQQAVIADVKAHLGINEVADDITLLVLKRR